MKVEVQLEKSSQCITYKDCINTYTKGALYCVLFQNSEGERVTHKYPIQNIFRVIEDYNKSKR